MKLLKFIIQRKILVSLMVVLVLMIGSYSVFKLDKELLQIGRASWRVRV